MDVNLVLGPFKKSLTGSLIGLKDRLTYRPREYMLHTRNEISIIGGQYIF